MYCRYLLFLENDFKMDTTLSVKEIQVQACTLLHGCAAVFVLIRLIEAICNIPVFTHC